MDLALALAQAVLVLAIFWIPGAMLLSLLRVRGLALVAVAPAATIALFSVGALLARALGMRWNLLAASVVTGLAVCALVGLLRWRAHAASVQLALSDPGAASDSGAARPDRPRMPGAVSLAIAASVLIQLAPVWRTFLRGDQVSNLTDPLFHLNALEYVRQTGIVTPDVLAGLADTTGRTALYPSGWHSVAGVVPVLLNNPSLLAAAQYLPLAVAATAGIAALARAALRGRGDGAVILAALLTASGVSLPLGTAIQPATIPNALAIALVPGALALLVAHASSPVTLRRRVFWPIFMTLSLGIALCHPNALVALALLAIPWVVHLAWQMWQRSTVLVRCAGVTAVVAASGGVMWLVLTSSTVALVGSIGVQAPQSLGAALSGLALGRIGESLTYAIVPTALAVLGAFRRVRERSGRRAVVSWGIMIACYLATATAWTWLAPLTGLFYDESRRLAPLVGIWTVVLAGDGLAWVSRGLVARVRVPERLGQRGGVVLVAGVLVAIPAFATFRTHEFLVSRIYSQILYTPVPESFLVPFFTPAELAMAERLPVELGSGARVLGSSYSGSSHLYGLEGIDVIPFYGSTIDEDLAYAADHIDELGRDPKVCASLRAHGVTHLYADPFLMRGESWPIWAAPFQTLPENGLRAVDSGGAVTVYEITGCSG